MSRNNYLAPSTLSQSRVNLARKNYLAPSMHTATSIVNMARNNYLAPSMHTATIPSQHGQK
jgi:hypothetical protein